MTSLSLRVSAYGETAWQRLHCESELAAQRSVDAVTVPSSRLAGVGLEALAAKVARNEMRISISPGSVRLVVEASSELTVDDVRELGDELFAFACQCTAALCWRDVPIDGVNFFA